MPVSPTKMLMEVTYAYSSSNLLQGIRPVSQTLKKHNFSNLIETGFCASFMYDLDICYALHNAQSQLKQESISNWRSRNTGNHSELREWEFTLEKELIFTAVALSH